MNSDFLIASSKENHSSNNSALRRAVADDYRDSLSDTTAPFGSLNPGSSATGSIETNGDRDVFAITLTAGQSYTFNLTNGASGGLADPYLRLLNASGTQLAADDDSGAGLNARITFTATSSGTYYLEARGYGSGTGSYSLSSTGTPTTPTDDYRDSLSDTTAPLGTVTVGGTASAGKVETNGDTDLFSVTLTAGQTYTFNLAGAASGAISDPMLRLLGSTGTELASNDDFGGTRNSQITFTAQTSGTYYLEAKGYGSATGNYSLSATSTTTPPAGGFDIDIRYSGDAAYQTYFDQAAARWEAIITGDLPNYTSSRYGLIDDLRIESSVVAIDGAGGVLGQAGPDEFRSGSSLPAHGIMQFDSADVANMAANGTLLGVILHEMGHVLGIGTLWDDLGLKNGNYAYTGANALAEYRTLAGDQTLSSIPLERTGGSGTAGSHWAEDVFGSELMTGYASGGLEMSRMTIASLADMGYAVDLSKADPYSLPGGALQGQFLVQPDEIYGIL